MDEIHGQLEDSEDSAVARMVARLRKTAPSCINGFRLTATELPVEWDDSCKSVWRLACACGEEQGRVLGYPLSDWNSEYRGPECFLSPLAFECSKCGKVIEIIDTDVHGYHSQLARIEGGVGSAKLRGEGPRSCFPCAACAAGFFAVMVGFVYWDGVFDFFLDEPDLPPEEFFIVFLCYGYCTACGHISDISDFGKL